MRILIVGAAGTIGSAVAAALGTRHDLVLASQQKASERVDIADPESIRALFGRIGRVDAVVSAHTSTIAEMITDPLLDRIEDSVEAMILP